MKKTNALPNCGPTAVAHLLGISVDEVMQEFRSTYGLDKRWKGRTNWWRLCGFIRQEAYVEEMKGKLSTRGTLNKWVENHTSSHGAYLVRVGDHFLAVINQKVYDNHGVCVEPSEHWCKNKRVTHAQRYTLKSLRDNFFKWRKINGVSRNS